MASTQVETVIESAIREACDRSVMHESPSNAGKIVIDALTTAGYQIRKETDDKYNGWANYATWRINLEICDDLVSGMIGEQTFKTVGALADYLETEVEEIISDYGTLEGLAIDYARSFVSDVNWYEIAEHAEELIAPDGDTEDEALCICGKPLDNHPTTNCEDAYQ